MGIKISSGPSNTTVIDVDPEPFPWVKAFITLVVVFAITGGVIFLLMQFFPNLDSGVGGTIAGAVGIVLVASTGQRRTKKITLTPQGIDVVKGSATNTVTIPVAQIKNCVIKKSGGGGGQYKFIAKDGRKITVTATAALFPALKTELQKRYKFPIT